MTLPNARAAFSLTTASRAKRKKEKKAHSEASREVGNLLNQALLAAAKGSDFLGLRKRPTVPAVELLKRDGFVITTAGAASKRLDRDHAKQMQHLQASLAVATKAFADALNPIRTLLLQWLYVRVQSADERTAVQEVKDKLLKPLLRGIDLADISANDWQTTIDQLEKWSQIAPGEHIATLARFQDDRLKLDRLLPRFSLSSVRAAALRAASRDAKIAAEHAQGARLQVAHACGPESPFDDLEPNTILLLWDIHAPTQATTTGGLSSRAIAWIGSPNGREFLADANASIASAARSGAIKIALTLPSKQATEGFVPDGSQIATIFRHLEFQTTLFAKKIEVEWNPDTVPARK